MFALSFGSIFGLQMMGIRVTRSRILDLGKHAAIQGDTRQQFVANLAYAVQPTLQRQVG